jgi:hypothetical protein
MQRLLPKSVFAGTLMLEFGFEVQTYNAPAGYATFDKFAGMSTSVCWLQEALDMYDLRLPRW